MKGFVNIKRVEVGQIFMNYKKLCSYLEEPVKSGKSKQLQLADWERYFSYHKIGNKIMVDKVYDEPLQKNERTSNNNKNIRPMIDYLLVFLEEDHLYWYHSFTTWYCDNLRLLNKDMCNAPYNKKMEVETFCKEKSIKDTKVLCEYVSATKAILKNIFLKALEHMKKKNLVEYSNGYIFTYALGKKSYGHFETDKLNDIILENETNICNAMNEEFNLSKKLKGRQNLLVIYGDEDLQVEFTERKVDMIMNSQESLDICNKVIEYDDKHFWSVPVSVDTPLLSYYNGIRIDEIEVYEKDNIEELGTEICNIIRCKVRKELLSKKYVNRYTGEIIYPYENCEMDILAIEKLLFNYFDAEMVKAHCFDPDDDTSDIDELFDGKSLWGKADPMENNYAVEEMLDMPDMNELHMTDDLEIQKIS